ncbi:hypothetical protein ACEN9F_13405 [Duganella sp. CT11-25]|uniref:hypothetical protein n=1 Tax=unclassified Duganella TaxID=2636909 RepID=UPI0039AF482C
MKILITSPVNHDGESLEIGATPNVSDRQARALIAAGSAEPYSGKEKADKDSGKPGNEPRTPAGGGKAEGGSDTPAGDKSDVKPDTPAGTDQDGK